MLFFGRFLFLPKAARGRALNPSAQIVIRDFVVHAYHGVYAEEGVTGTSFRIHLVIDISPDLPGFLTDALDDTLNYETVISRVYAVVTQNRFHLLERLCRAICDALLCLERILSVDVTVEKYLETLTPSPQWFGVRLVRGRDR